MEILINPMVHVYPVLTFVIAITAVTFIALILFLNRAPLPEPVALPSK
jgi:hypothetical protein